MGVTISTHNGSKMARDHNIRNKKVVSKENHIDPNGVYEIWIDEPIRKAYDRLFGAALKAYNANQSRPERKIDSYYHVVCKDKKKHPVYEMVIGVYGKNENGSPICSTEQGKDIMRTFVENWRERNPNLELIGAYYHADEPNSEPHVHIDYVPIAHGYKRGLETQTGLVKALGEQGFEKKGKVTAQIQWEQRENDYLTSLCECAGFQVEHPQVEGRKHIDTDIFKLQTQKQQLEEHIKPFAEMKIKTDMVDEQAKNLPFGRTMVDTKALERMKKQAKAYIVNRDQIRTLKADQQQVKKDKAENESTRLEVQALYQRQLEINQILEQKEMELKAEKEKTRSLTAENAYKNKFITELKQNKRTACEALSVVSKAIGMLKYAKNSDYATGLTPKQARLVDAVANYALDFVSNLGYFDLAKEIESNVGISKEIQAEIIKLEPHKRSRGMSR